jgi:hypothetical protein
MVSKRRWARGEGGNGHVNIRKDRVKDGLLLLLPERLGRCGWLEAGFDEPCLVCLVPWPAPAGWCAGLRLMILCNTDTVMFRLEGSRQRRRSPELANRNVRVKRRGVGEGERALRRRTGVLFSSAQVEREPCWLLVSLEGSGDKRTKDPEELVDRLQGASWTLGSAWRMPVQDRSRMDTEATCEAAEPTRGKRECLESGYRVRLAACCWFCRRLASKAGHASGCYRAQEGGAR